MASTKPSKKTTQKDANATRDSLDLRDEILNLKREIAALRKERDKLVIRLRKSDDESKRKDRQIEQLMDPTQNSEIRRLLSMKGAALLLNLKDQNNTLVQMLMDKNQHIKRLGNEIKTAKLYARTNKTEPYRLEISRLRSLLLQSQEALKEAAHGPQVPSACLSAKSSTSSDETAQTSRELEELRFMVHSLETHMQYSKELLNKKNQEISTLSQELGNVLEGHCCQRKLGDNTTERCAASATFLDSFQIGKSAKPKKTAGEKWKNALQKIHRRKKLHTNSTADDELVWSVLKSTATSARKLSLPTATIPTAKPSRKLSLPVIFDKNSSKSEIGNHTCKTFTYRPNGITSTDSEMVQLVVAEIHAVSDSNDKDDDRCESQPDDNTNDNPLKKENCISSGNEQDNEDDDDVITI